MLFTAERAQAQAPSEGGSDYTQLTTQAVLEFNSGHWAEARALFEQAHGIHPNARTERGLGLTSFELRHYVDCVAELESALNDSRNPLTAEQRAEATDVLSRARNFVGTLRVELTPSDAVLLLDGLPVSKRDFALNVGDYTLSASAPEYRDAALDVYIEGGQTRTVQLALVRAGGAHSFPDARIHDSEVSGPTPRSIIAWSLVGAGAVGLALGVVFEVVRANDLSDRDRICPTSIDCMPGDQTKIDHLTSSARTASVVGLIGLIGGAALATGGVGLLLTTPKTESRSGMALIPRVSRDVQGIVLTGAW